MSGPLAPSWLAFPIRWQVSGLDSHFARFQVQDRGSGSDAFLGIFRSGFGVHGVQKALQALLLLVVKTGKLNAHSHTAVAGPHNRRSRDLVGFHPESDSQFFAHRKWEHGLYITPAAVYVCRLGPHKGFAITSVGYLDGKGNFVARELPLVFRGR